jgi:hypothetical protein
VAGSSAVVVAMPYVLLVAFMVLGGLGLVPALQIVVLASILAAAFFLLRIFLRSKLLKPAKEWFFFGFWLILVWVHSLFLPMSQFGTQLMLVCMSGWLWWWAGMHGQRKPGMLQTVILLTGCVYLILYGLSLWGIMPLPLGAQGAIIEASGFENHYYWGDWWMMVGVLFIAKALVGTWRGWYGMVLPFVFGVMLASGSRTALVGIAVGVGYAIWKSGQWQRIPVWLRALVVSLFVVVFVAFSSQRPLLLSRPYYFQSVAALWRHPLGVGMGHFGKVSSEDYFYMTGMGSNSSLAHNLALEFVVGMGWLGLLFVGWWVRVVWKVVGSRGKDQVPIEAVWLALSVVFLFTTAYMIPSFVWIWFLLLPKKAL